MGTLTEQKVNRKGQKRWSYVYNFVRIYNRITDNAKIIYNEL